VKSAALSLALVAATSGIARAQIDLDGPIDSSTQYQSSQHFAVELKFGSYSPDIDSSPGLTGKPFSDLFQSQTGTSVGQRPGGRLLTSLEFDWQIFHWPKIGSLGLGATVGITHRTTHSFEFVMGGDGTMTSCVVPMCVRSGDETALNVMPFTLEVVYRFDVLANRYHIPIVPYVKGGLGYYLWWMTNGSGDLSHALNPNPDGSFDAAIGGTFGLVAHPGIALQLDILDATAARTIDNEIGINHSYLFAELAVAWITGFGASNKLVLSDTAWNAGIAFEF
jgi:hypothetical protein